MKRMRTSAVIAVVAGLAVTGLAVAGSTTELEAQEREGGVVFGAQGLWGSDTDFGLGGRVLGNIETLNLEAAGEFNLFFPDAADYWEINGFLFYHFHLPDTESVLPYFGGGIGIQTFEPDVDGGDSETDFGVNAAAGIRFPTTTSVTPYVEGRAQISDIDQFVFTAGLLFGRAGFR